MACKPGTTAPQTGIYWCSVCKLPGQFEQGQLLPECRNKCGRGGWDFVRATAPASAAGVNATRDSGDGTKEGR